MRYEAIIVGGGIMGTATAFALLQRGLRNVLVLEKSTIGNDRAASTDRTKAIRYEYGAQAHYSRMVGKSIELWTALQQQTGRDLYVNCGVLCWGTEGQSVARLSYDTLAPMGIPIREIDKAELKRRFPQFNADAISYATYNSEGGFLRASNCVEAFATRVRQMGGEMKEGAALARLEQSDGGVGAILESGERLEAERVAIAAGAWGANLLPALGLHVPLTANKQQVVYLDGLGANYGPGSFPVFLNLDHDFYGFPLDVNGQLKASVHAPGPVIDPDAPLPADATVTEEILSLIGLYIPGAARGRIANVRTCMYAMTPDEDFIVDRLPGADNVVIAAGFSGHGFKFGPLVGQMTASLLLDEEPVFWTPHFALGRFAPGIENPDAPRPHVRRGM